MAEKFTILPSFVGQESNTAVLNDNVFADKLIEASRLKYAMDEAKHQAEQERLAKSIDFKSGDILQVDMEYINGQRDEYLKWISANTELLAKQDPMTVSKQKQWKNKIDTQTDIAIGRKKQVDNQQTYLQTDAARSSGYGLQEDFDAVNNFANTPMGEWKGYNARDLYNELTYFKDYNIETQKTVDDKGYTKTTINKTPSEDIISIADKKINSPEYNQLVGHYLKLSNGARNKTTIDADVVYYDPEDFKKNGDMATPKVIKLSQITPDNIGSIVPYKKSALDEAYKNLKEEDKQVPSSSGGSGSGGSDNKPITNWVSDWTLSIVNDTITGGVDVFDSSSKTVSGKRFNAPSDLTMPIVGSKSGEKERVVGIYKKNNGKYYVMRDTDFSLNKSGTYSIKEGKQLESANNEIKSMWTDIIAPYFASKYGTDSDDKLEEYRLQMWENNPQEANQLGIPKPINFKDNTSTTNNTSGKKYKGLDKNGNPIFE
jgi:hypothetical protein